MGEFKSMGEFKIGDWVVVKPSGHTFHGTFYASEAMSGSVGVVSYLNDDGTVRVWWSWHPDEFEGVNDHHKPKDYEHHSQADRSCLFRFSPVDVTSIESVEAFLNEAR